MSNHTPGPWFLWAQEHGGFTVTSDETMEGAVICSRNDWNHRASESLTNARLISSAPEMRELIDVQANIIDALIERLSEADIFDEMDQVEFNKWSQKYQMLVAKIEGTL